MTNNNEIDRAFVEKLFHTFASKDLDKAEKLIDNRIEKYNKFKTGDK